MAQHPDVESILLTREQIARRVTELGRAISRDYEGRDLVLVGVLKGAVVFLADLMRAVAIPHRFELIDAASYGSRVASSGEVTIAHRMRFPLKGCDVLIVEDILDSGTTVKTLMEDFETHGARSVALCVFLDKQRERAIQITPRYVGFEVPDRFVVGYGLDYAERCRHLDYVGILKRSAYERG